MRNRRKPQKHIIPLKLDPALAARIDALVNVVGESKATIMRMALRIGLRPLEAAHKIKPAGDPITYQDPPDSGLSMNETGGKK